MRRRDLLLMGGGILVTSKSTLGARKIPRIGFIASGSRELSVNLLDAFRHGLNEFGWVEDRDLVVLDRWAEEYPDRLRNIAREFKHGCRNSCHGGDSGDIGGKKRRCGSFN